MIYDTTEKIDMLWDQRETEIDGALYTFSFHVWGGVDPHVFCTVVNKNGEIEDGYCPFRNTSDDICNYPTATENSMCPNEFEVKDTCPLVRTYYHEGYDEN